MFSRELVKNSLNLSYSLRKIIKTVAENRSELGDRLGQAIREKPGSMRNQRVFYERTFNREQNCVITDMED